MMLDQSSLDTSVAQISTASRLLIALDFDGTLAEFTLDPDEARMSERTHELLSALVDVPRTHVALVSGRSLNSLRRVVNPLPRVHLVASHGAQVQIAGSDPQSRHARGELVTPLTADEHRRLEVLTQRLEVLAAESAGLRVERKPAGLALHTRGVQPQDQIAVHHQFENILRMHADGFSVLQGAEVVELSLRPIDKGEGLTRLRDVLAADRVFYAGDDTTDERAFAVLRATDLGVKCGKGTTLAQHCVASIDDVTAVLSRIRRMRLASIAG